MLYDKDRPHSTQSFPAVFTQIQAPRFHGVFDWNTMGIALLYPQWLAIAYSKNKLLLIRESGSKGRDWEGASLTPHSRTLSASCCQPPAALLTTVVFKPVLHRAALRKPTGHRLFPSFTNSHFQNEAQSKTFLVKMSDICLRVNIIFMSMASHLTSLWNRGLRQLRNGGMLWAFRSALARGKRSLFLSSLSVSLSRVPVHGWITRILSYGSSLLVGAGRLQWTTILDI